MRPLKSSRLRRRTAVLALAVATLSLSAVVTAGPAAAASCSPWNGEYVDAGPASASIWMSDRCSDGRIHLEGTVWDDACDDRSAHLYLRFYHDGDMNGRFQLYRTEDVYAHGCGNDTSYEFNTVDRTGYSNDVKVRACVWAENFWTSSSSDCEWVWPY